mgnify:CR=1 FL=1
MTHESPAPRPVESSLAPVGKLGFRGRRATPEERSRILDAYYFEGERRTPYLQQYFVLMVLSAAIAAFGLANNSAAVVIGAMLVAPLMTPILAVSAAIVQGWSQRVVDSVLIVAGGALAAIGVGLIVGLLVPSLRTGLPLPGELLARTGPNLIDLFIALAAGAAGGFVAVRTEASGALPGVGIAVALVPPLATVGICLGLGELGLALGALLLFGTNFVAIVVAAGLVLVGAGFAAFRGEREERGAVLARRLVWLGLLVVAIPLAFHSWDRYVDSVTRAELSRDTQDWAPQHIVRGVWIERAADPAVVRVELAGAGEPPDPDALAQAVAENLGRAVKVEIAYAPLREGNAPAP